MTRYKDGDGEQWPGDKEDDDELDVDVVAVVVVVLVVVGAGIEVDEEEGGQMGDGEEGGCSQVIDCCSACI